MTTDEHARSACPVDASHDRLVEASHFLAVMEREYHSPQMFRFNLNAFIAALRASSEILQKDVERLGAVQQWNALRREFQEDPILRRFFRARNVSLHQKTIYDGSEIQTGLFRARKLKFAMEMHLSDDRTSQQILTRLQGVHNPYVDPGHAAIGEQLGVKRRYLIKELSPDEDALLANRRAFARMTVQLNEAHQLFDSSSEVVDEGVIVQEESLLPVTVLLETDVDPALTDKWGWR